MKAVDLIAYFLLIFCLSCGEKASRIVPLKQKYPERTKKIDGKMYHSRSEYFLIINYSNLKEIERKVDSIALSLADITLQNITTFQSSFIESLTKQMLRFGRETAKI